MFRKWIESRFWRYHDLDVSGREFEDIDTEAVFMEVAQIPVFKDFLKALLRNDKAAYFKAHTDGERSHIRGKYLRGLQLYRKLSSMPSRSKDVKGDKPVLGGRYG